MIGRVRVFETADGLAVERVREFSPRIAKGVFRFSVQEPSSLHKEFAGMADAFRKTGLKADVFGVAYGEPGLYFGTLEDISRGDRYSAVVAMSLESALRHVSITVAALESGRRRVYFLGGEVHSDFLFSSDLEPGTEVAFRGAKIAASP